MQIPLYQVDAFTSELFRGNPAAVCVTDEPLAESVMQNIAAENNLSETAFLVRKGDRYSIRWFTPVAEVDICGHATLASGFVVFNFLKSAADFIEFESKSGLLTVHRSKDLLTLDFPVIRAVKTAMNDRLSEALGLEPVELHNTRRTMTVFETESQIRDLAPDFGKLFNIEEYYGVIVTAPGDEVDFVSRFFAPRLGIDEDPVTGSAHCALTPYWSERLVRKKLHARQISKRGGELWCEDCGERIRISGRAVLYLNGEIYI